MSHTVYHTEVMRGEKRNNVTGCLRVLGFMICRTYTGNITQHSYLGNTVCCMVPILRSVTMAYGREGQPPLL
jgi:hypothetical protein